MHDSGSGIPKPDRRLFLLWGILAGGALILRALFMQARLVLSGDEVHYAESLHHFLNGRFIDGVSDYWSVLYPLAAVPFGRLYGGVEPALRLVSVLSGAAAVVPIMYIASRLHGWRAALFTGALVAMHPTLITFSAAAMTEPLYSLLLMMSVLFMILFMERGGWRELVPAGLLLGLAFLVRQEAQFILAIYLLAILIGRGGEGLKAPAGRRIGRAAVMAGLFIVVTLPYLAAVHQKTGRWTAGSKAAVNLSSPAIWEEGLERERYVYSLNEEGTRRRIDEIGSEGAVRVLWRQRGAIASRYLPEMNGGVKLLPLLLGTPLLLILVPLGLFGRAWKRERRGAEFLLLVLGFFPFVLYSIFRIEIRYLVPFLPLYLLWGGVGCDVIVTWVRENVSRHRALGLATLLVIFMSLVPVTIRRYASVRRSQPLEYIEIGRAVASLGERGKVLAHPGCSASFYAGVPEATFIPWTDMEGLRRYARMHGYRYLVVDEDYIRGFRPTLGGFLDGSDMEGFERVLSVVKETGGAVVLYRFEPDG